MMGKRPNKFRHDLSFSNLFSLLRKCVGFGIDDGLLLLSGDTCRAEGDFRR